MDGSITISAADRKTLLALVRSAVGVCSRQAHVVLLGNRPAIDVVACRANGIGVM